MCSLENKSKRSRRGCRKRAKIWLLNKLSAADRRMDLREGDQVRQTQLEDILLSRFELMRG